MGGRGSYPSPSAHPYMEYLKRVNESEAIAVMKMCKVDKHIHRFHKRGFTNDKGRTMRKIAHIPLSVLFNPEYSKYFHKDADTHERDKDIENFLHDHPEYKCND